MTWRSLAWPGAVGLASALVGCSDRPPPKPLFPPVSTTGPAQPGEVPGGITAVDAAGEHTAEGRAVVLDSVVQMLQKAALNPGGDIFTIATERLNHYFADTDSSAFLMSEPERAYLKDRLPPPLVEPLENREFTIRDARHIEDCMLYRSVATRVGGDGDDLTRARRVFDWTARQVELVPLGSLAPPGLPQAAARPYDVLLRAMATEPGGLWAERSWLFVALCRQLGLDAGLLTINKEGKEEPTAWAVAVLIDGKPYLFDARIGLPVPGPDGRPVATLDEVVARPELLDRLDLPGHSPYPVDAADLAGGKVDVQIDTTLGYLSPRMRSLEKELSGRNRLNLFRDPADEQAAFAAALGDHLSAVRPWTMTYEIEVRLFTDPQFVQAAQYPLQWFDSKLPLLSARMAQLRGDLPTAIQSLVALRYKDNPTIEDPADPKNKIPIPPEVQSSLDMIATYFLGLGQHESGHEEQAEFFFKECLRLFPEPRPGQPFALFSLYRWGAQTNLGLLYAAHDRPIEAIRQLSSDTLTAQTVGNRLRARDLIWSSPFDPEDAGTAESTASVPR